MFVDKLFGAIHHPGRDREHVREKGSRQFVDLLPFRPSPQGAVAVDYLLENLRVDGGSDLSIRDPVEEFNGRTLVLMFRTSGRT